MPVGNYQPMNDSLHNQRDLPWIPTKDVWADVEYPERRRTVRRPPMKYERRWWRCYTNHRPRA